MDRKSKICLMVVKNQRGKDQAHVGVLALRTLYKIYGMALVCSLHIIQNIMIHDDIYE
jgi:hypothetical protein